ncbi:MAG: YqeG family HAD IIIA-type phosphatase [Bacilli bacterium]|jgi:HAD superfamily phosphatase (TIGR01668 family)
MNKRFIPFCVAKSIYDIEPAFFQKHNISILFVDLDNTLDAYQQSHPTKKAYALKEKLTQAGIEIIVVSNNTSKRVSTYAKELGVRHAGSLFKPFAFKLKKFIKKHNIDISMVMMIGDQIITDVACGNGAGIKTILTDRLVEDDQWTTRFNRCFDRPRYQKMKKMNLLISWEER